MNALFMAKTTKVTIWLALAAGVIAVLLLGRRAAALLPALTEWVSAQGAIAPLAFGLVYIAATILLVPGSLLTLAAGALFGLVKGTVTVLIAASIGACAAFLIARYAARERVARMTQSDARFAAIDRAIENAGLKIVLLLRLSPVFPFNLLNYALGLTSVRFRDYAIACIAMLPGTLLYVYYGRLIGDVAALAAGERAERGFTYYLLLGAGLLATIAVTAVITRIARRELQRNAPDAI
jgi:uncharacterized membrane protein YdjX (TVP38/TMEM64 family)